MQTVLLALGAVVVYGLYSCVTGLRFNIAEAKRSGLPYVVVPCSPVWIPWQVTHKLWIPFIKLAPKSWWEPWLDMATPDSPYRHRIEAYRRFGDCYLVVSPGRIQFNAANAEAIRHMTMRREQFPKWVELYGILRLFGENVISTEGPPWRMHRKVTAPSFNERNAALIFREAVIQTQGMLEMWVGPEGRRSEPVRSGDEDTLKLALHIISYVGFGLRLLWPGQTPAKYTDPKLLKYGTLEAPPGHTRSFGDALVVMLDNILLIMLTPAWLLKLLPTKSAKDAVSSRDDYVKYMDQMLDEKIDDARKGDHAEEGMDLLGQLARTSYGPAQEKANGDASGKSNKLPQLTRDEILGNAFVMFVAGHETTASSVHFTLAELATNPSAQRRLQKDIDELLGDSDPSTWDYDAVMNPMNASMVGACMYETLRLVPPVVEIPKKLTTTRDEELPIDGKTYIVPKGSVILLAAMAVQHNPRYWPTRPSKIDPSSENDVSDYVPERWFKGYDAAKTGSTSTNVAGVVDTSDPGADKEDFGGPEGPDTSSQLFRPERGAYVPFSDGARACLGRRTAQVEIMGALAVIFRSHSIELATDEWASQKEVEAMGKEDRKKVYKKAQDKARKEIDQAVTRITLKLGADKIPFRVVKRGEEKFVNWME